MSRRPYCPGPGDLGLDELYDAEMSDIDQRALDAEADADVEDEDTQESLELDRELWLID